jgi:LmbE family N-acetylglucosaminyl deacetylase
VSLPAWVTDAGRGASPEEIDVTLDVSSVLGRKKAAIVAHESQIDNRDLVTMSDDLFRLLSQTEFYQLGWSRVATAVHPTDLLGELP